MMGEGSKAPEVIRATLPQKLDETDIGFKVAKPLES